MPELPIDAAQYRMYSVIRFCVLVELYDHLDAARILENDRIKIFR